MKMSDLDNLTDAEQSYFKSGEVTDQLLTENKQETPPPVVEEKVEPVTEQKTEQKTEQQQPPPEDIGDEPGAPGQPPKRVGYRRYQEVEQRALNAEKRLQETSVQSARVEERLKLLQEALQEPEVPEPTEVDMPNPEEDIFGAFNWAVRRLNDVSTKVATYESQIATGQREMENERRYFDDINNYIAVQPHFINAYNYLLQGRTLDLMAQRFQKPDGMSPEDFIQAVSRERIPQDVQEQVRQEERSLYREAFSKNQSPADHIYRYALARGFKPVVKPAQQQLTQQPDVSRGTNSEQKPNATQIVEGIQKGQAAAKSLSNVSGSAGGAQITPQMLVDMSEEDFAKFYEALVQSGDKTKLKELFGS
jgi:hypothetical protein